MSSGRDSFLRAPVRVPFKMQTSTTSARRAATLLPLHGIKSNSFNPHRLGGDLVPEVLHELLLLLFLLR